MDNNGILEQLKQINIQLENALKEVEKGQDITFFKALVQKNAIDLYQKASMLDQALKSRNPEIKIITHEQVSRPEPPEKKEEPAVTEPVKNETPAEPVPEEKVQVVEKTVPAEQKHIETAPSPAPKPKVIATTVEDDQELSLNEKLSKNKQPVMNIADKSKETAIKDLVKFISIGKKFEFINGLFDGNADVYKTALQTVQHASSYEEATQYLESNITGPYEWDANENLAAEFFSLVKRRFS